MFDVVVEVPVDPAAAFAVWTDVASWPSWDPHEVDARLNGDFAPGTTGWAKPKGAPAGDFTLREVVVDERWVSVSPLPGGALTFTHSVEQTASGSKLSMVGEVRGPMTPLLRVFWAKGMRRDAPRTLEAIGVEALRRKAAGTVS